MRVHISRFNKYMQTETSSEIYFFPLFFFFWSIYYGCISFHLYEDVYEDILWNVVFWVQEK